MMHRASPALLRRGAVAIAATIAFAATAQGVVVSFADRTAFNAAAGTIDINENFSGFPADAPFRTVPVPATGFVLSQDGVNQNFRNLVDVPPLGFTEHNGTAYVSSYTNAAEGTAAGTQIRATFPIPVRAVGADFYNSTISEGLTMDVYSGGSVIASFPVPLIDNSFTFFGVVATGGENITSLQLRSTNILPGTAGEGFGMDDFALSVIPEPATGLVVASMALLLTRPRQ